MGASDTSCLTGEYLGSHARPAYDGCFGSCKQRYRETLQHGFKTFPARLRKRGDRSPDGRVAGGAGFDGNIFGFFLPKFVVLQGDRHSAEQVTTGRVSRGFRKISSSNVHDLVHGR
jgi:hypothetical protein